MNFGEWTENRRKEKEFLPEQENVLEDYSAQPFGGGSFGNDRSASRNGGRLAELPETDVETSTYSPIKGLAGGLQKGLTDIAKKGSSLFALAEDIQYVPLELMTGHDFGELSDNGFMNRWNDSIRREVSAVEDYYADNIAAGGKSAELLDKSVSKIVSFLPSAAMEYYLPGAGAAAELGNAAANSTPGIASSFRTVTEKLAKDPKYWLSVAGTMGERYEDAMDGIEDADFGDWAYALARSAAESLYKEAIGTSKVLPDDFSAMAELTYEMFGKEAGEDKESFLDRLAELFL